MKRTEMRKIKEELELHFNDKKLSTRTIGGHVKSSLTAVGNYNKRFEKSGLRWSLSENLTNRELEKFLFLQNQHKPVNSPQVPD